MLRISRQTVLVCVAASSLIFCSVKPYGRFNRPCEVLEIIQSVLPENPVILEAGAYDGRDSVRMVKHWAEATLYAFEPVPELYQKVLKKTHDYKNIHTYQLALSDAIGDAVFYVSEQKKRPDVPSASSSLLQPLEHLQYAPEVLFTKKITVQTTTIDAWAEKNGIKNIDFMWLDMQGYEMNALKASPNILKTVKAILTEVTFVEAYKGQYLYEDVKAWLEQMGFQIIATDFEASEQKRIAEKKWFGNALFVRKSPSV